MATLLRRPFDEGGELPGVDQAMSSVIFWAIFSTASVELRGAYEMVTDHRYQGKTCMSVEYIEEPKPRMGDNNAGSCLANEPVTSRDIKRGSI